MKSLLSLLPTIKITLKRSKRAQRRLNALQLLTWEVSQALLEIS